MKKYILGTIVFFYTTYGMDTVGIFPVVIDNNRLDLSYTLKQELANQQLYSIDSLPHLQVLYKDHIQTLGNISELNLNVSHNNLKSGIGLDKLKLKSLDASFNSLSSLPSLSNLKDLEKLNLSHNKLTALPQGLSCLKKLKRIDISDNQFKDIESISKKIKDWIPQCVIRSDTKLVTLQDIKETIKVINMGMYNIVNLSDQMLDDTSHISTFTVMHKGKKTSLKDIPDLELWLHRNYLKELSDDLFDMDNIIALKLNNNLIKHIAMHIRKLPLLTKLYLENNNLSQNDKDLLTDLKETTNIHISM